MLAYKPSQTGDGLQEAGRRPFLLPRLKARRLNMLLLLSSVGDLGLPLSEGWDCDEADDSEAERSRPSRRISSRETLRCG